MSKGWIEFDFLDCILLMAKLVLSVWVFAFMGWFYYLRQKRNAKMGGEISLPKTFWLFFALYCYYILPFLLLWEVPFNAFWSRVMVSMLLVNYSRLIVQGLSMYVYKNWHPIHGMIWNLSAAVIILSVTLVNWDRQVPTLNAPGYVVFLLLYLVLVLTDTYYAYTFKEIVGKSTTGDHPVWFASNRDPRFTKINRITSRNNVLFSMVFICMAILIYAKF
jgi:hypothetical protein